MKAVICILLYVFVTITICPVSKLIACTVSPKCEMLGRLDQSHETESEDAACPLEMCKSCQCCCLFACPVVNEKAGIRVFEEESSAPGSKDDHAVAGFQTNCWQPPEA